MTTETNGSARADRVVANSVRVLNRSEDDALWMFPGQGAQTPGMCARMLTSYAPAAHLLDRAEELSGRQLREPCLQGPMQQLNESETLQPLWTALLLGCAARLADHGATPMAVAGHSLGEWAALATAGVITSDDALKLASLRGALMAEAARNSAGGMLAVLDLDPSDVERLVSELDPSLGVVVANDNSPRQQVASGSLPGLEQLAERVAMLGGKSRALDVVGAWHCPTPSLMAASAEFTKAIDFVEFHRARVPILLNATGRAEVDANAIRAAMHDQMVQPVRWRGLIEEAFAGGCGLFLEVGPSRVLRGLLRQILPDPKSYKVNLYDGAAPPTLARKIQGATP